MTIISWSLEFIDGGLIVYHIFTKHADDYMLPVHLFLRSILIPGSYIIKTDAVKKVVAASGWMKTFEDFVPCGKNRIVPNEEINMNVIRNVPPRHNDILAPIPVYFPFTEFPDISIFD